MEAHSKAPDNGKSISLIEGKIEKMCLQMEFEDWFITYFAKILLILRKIPVGELVNVLGFDGHM